MSGSHVIRYSRLRRGEYYADFRRDEQQTPEVYHCVIQRDGSPEVLWLSQFTSLREATRVVEKRLRCLCDDQFESAA